MYSLKTLFTNYFLMSAVCSWLAAQFLKICFGIFKIQKFSIGKALFGTGGMPSSHTAAVCGLCTSFAVVRGLGDSSFAICGLLCIIVITDALGVRRETGLQSKMLNELLNKEQGLTAPEHSGGKFRELIGHTPLQVIVGVVVGVSTAILIHLIPVFAV